MLRRITLLLVLLVVQNSIAQQIITPEKKQKLDEYLAYISKENQGIGEISITENGKEIYGKSFGYENLEEKVENPESLRYQMGSISKSFTAVLLAMLEEEGKLSYDEKLENYFPKIKNSEKITIRQMMNHTSGLNNFAMQYGDSTWLMKKEKKKNILKRIQGEEILFEPREGFEYSNSAYYLLAKIVEKKYKKSYHKVLNEKILKPLKLKETQSYVFHKKTKMDHVAQGYILNDGKWEVVEDFYFPNIVGVGDIVSTTEELNEFFRALFQGELIKKESLDKMLAEGKAPFGLGLMQVFYEKVVSHGHGGDTIGTHSVAVYHPEEDLGLSVVLNGYEYARNPLLIGILDIIFNDKLVLPDFSKFKIEDLTPYLGKYKSEDLPFKVEIYEKDGEIMAQAEGQGAFPITPKNETKFEFIPAGVEMVFDLEKKTFVLHQGGGKFTFQKEE
ncbi:serine hydrolase domain-containing protein [Aureivirga sp. CE67]|uniref:serine hydrolase domain-containing protein n=1 Tax=Aureivirga sp. CE67 TaxID=1788983 RepID=UPI0018CB3FEF|nr:serine hydrolase domain-containing protein [Aureivirga sp. CE67]